MASARRERLKHELREEILEAARDLFVKNGYASVNMRAIAQKVGCSPGTLYLYFKDKDAILGAICQETFEKLDRHMEAIANDTGDPLGRLRRAGRLYVQFGLNHPDHYFLTFAVVGFSGFNPEDVPLTGIRSFDCLRRNVGACIEQGQLRITDVEEVAQSLWASIHGLVMLFIGKPCFPFIERNRLIDAVMDIAIEGIRKR